MNQFFSQENQETSKQFKTQNINITEHKKIRFCQNCGSKLDDRDLFCTECGEKVEIVQNIEQEPKTEEQPKVQISKDRMNAILNAREDLKSTFSDDVKRLTKDNKSSIKELSISQNQKISQNDNRTGFYIHKDSIKTEYLIIESIEGNSVTGKIRDSFHETNGYGNEFFSGTIIDNSIEINRIQRQNTNCIFIWDLHFSGAISDNTISGTWTRIGGIREFMVYTKIL